MSLGIERIITRQRICSIMGISADTLTKWINERGFPKPINASGRSPIFDKKLVDEWLSNPEKQLKITDKM